jgi:hypothetical protein
MVGLYKLNSILTLILKAPGFNPLNLKCDFPGFKICFQLPTCTTTSWMEKNKEDLSTLTWQELAERMKKPASEDPSRTSR